MEYVKKPWNFMFNNPKGQIIPLAVILALVGYFYFHNLGSDYITLWDEAVHINVVKNLANDPWPPRLHLTDIGIDFQDWTNNYIWVHKPLAPLYLQALVYKISPTLFAFRLPSVLFALMSIIALFFMARRHFGYIVAIISASLFAFNFYVFELVKGRQFSGLHDLVFVFFAILALDRILSITSLSSRALTRSASDEERRDPLTVDVTLDKGFLGRLGMTSKKNYLLFGLFAGLAYLSKGGLALLFFPTLFAVTFVQGESLRHARIPLSRLLNPPSLKPPAPAGGINSGSAAVAFLPDEALAKSGAKADERASADSAAPGAYVPGCHRLPPVGLHFLYAILIAFFIIFPEKITLLLLYPAEYYFEQSVQVLHLFQDLEYWGRPWDYYLTVYLRDLTLPYLYLPVIASVFYGFWTSIKNYRLGKNLNTVQYFRNWRITILTLWILAFIIPLSFGMTKISNFIFAALPAILILTSLMFHRLWIQKYYAMMFALSATTILSYALIRLDVFRAKYHLFQDQVILQRFAVLFYEVLVFLALLIIYKILEKYISLKIIAKAAAIVSLVLILGTYARANQLSDIKNREDYQYQQKVKQAALTAKDNYQKEAIFLLSYPKLLKSHLYFQYWSGLEAMEIYDRQPIFVLKKILPQNRPVFVISQEPISQPDLKFIEKANYGFVYSFSYDN